MAEKDYGPPSDAEGGERPVRERLRKAHITHDPNAPTSDAAPAAVATETEDGNEESTSESAQKRGRLHRKRSYEEVEGDSTEVAAAPPRSHTRKRSRDSTAEEDELNNGQRKVSGERPRNGDEAGEVDMEHSEANGTAKPPRPATPELSSEKRTDTAVADVASPKTKRSRLHSATVDADAALPEEKAVGEEKIEKDVTSNSRMNGDAGEPATKIPPTSGFANSSAASPFAALARSKSPSSEQQTSASAFAASGFSALSGSSASGFGAIAKDSGGFGSGGSFATGGKSPLKLTENEKSKSPPGSTFGSALGQSAFSAAPSGSGLGFGSGFGSGKLGGSSVSGFGSGIGGTGFSSLGGGGLSSFASGKPIAPLGSSSKSTKGFGAPADDDEGEDEEDDRSGAKSPIASEAEKQDERFYEQSLETGEENEKTEFSCRAKLYNFSTMEDGKKEWRERGLGVVKFNIKKVPDGDEKPKGRLVMRAEGSHRVVLNTPVKKELKFGNARGDEPTNGYLYFMGTIDNKDSLELLQLKMKQANALDMYESIKTLQEEM